VFRAELQWLTDGPTLKLEGRLADGWAEQARSLVTRSVVPNGLIVDLSDVTYVDSVGEELLTWLSSIGAEFVAETVYALDTCERLRLQLFENVAGQEAPSTWSARTQRGVLLPVEMPGPPHGRQQ